jgi:two-component system, cell cycle response regulator
LQDSALIDALTGLKNRRYLQEYTEKIVAGVLRRGKSIGFIMCDLDYFKQVNDTYGHNAGDIVLKETSRVISQSIRASDIVIRFGGEEFLAVLLDVGEGQSLKIAEKIRENIQQLKIKLPDGIIQKAISLGVSEFPAATGTLWSCITLAMWHCIVPKRKDAIGPFASLLICGRKNRFEALLGRPPWYFLYQGIRL